MIRDYSQPLVGVCVAIRRNDKVLLQLRNGSHCANLWGFPGGHLEKNESFEFCALRETFEECGSELIISIPKFWTAENVIIKEEDKHYATIFMVADWIEGEALITEPSKNLVWEWIAWTKMPSNTMPGIKSIWMKDLSPFDL